jgi:hypothetical protein
MVRASGVTMETTAVAGSTFVGPSGVAVRRTGSPAAWHGEVTWAVWPRTAGNPAGVACARPAGVTGTAGKAGSQRPRLAEQRVVHEVPALRRSAAGCLRQVLCAGEDPAEVAQRAGNSVEVSPVPVCEVSL